MKRFIRLLNDYGYDFQGNVLIEKAIKGFTSARVVGRFRDAYDAAVYMCPIIHDDEYTRRLTYDPATVIEAAQMAA